MQRYPAAESFSTASLRSVEPRFGGRQGREKALGGLHPRNMRVAKYGEPVGVHRDDRVESLREGGGGLAREAVDQVEVDRREAGVAEKGDRLLREFARLNAMDRRLNIRIEVLDADRGAAKSAIPQCGT